MAYLEFLAAQLGDHPVRNIAGLTIVVVLGHRVFQYLTAWLSLSRTYKLNGCERPVQYPHKDPVFGLDILFANIGIARDRKWIETQYQRFVDLGANTYGTWVRGRQMIHTIEPENIKCILATNFKDYSIGGRVAIMSQFLRRGIFVSEGDDWAHARALLRPNFARDQVADLDLLERHFQEMLSVLPAQPSKVADLQDYFLRFTLDSASEFLFGHSTNTLVKPSARDQAFGEAFRFSLGYLTKQFRRGPLNRFFRRDPKADEMNQICRDYVGRYVDGAMALQEKDKTGALDEGGENAAGRYTFLKELTKVLDSKEQICDELLTMMAAGRDTTASLISSAFHVLSHRPDLWRKLQNEVQELNGQPPTYEQLRNLKFAKYMINETLRCYPPAFSNGRMSIRDSILPTGGGPDGTSPIFVPKNTAVIYSTYSLHRRKDLFGPDAMEFRPERWATQRHGWNYIPFGGGPRICIGQQYALTEATYVMVRMAQAFASVETADNAPWIEEIGITTTIHGGVKCRLTRASE